MINNAKPNLYIAKSIGFFMLQRKIDISAKVTYGMNNSGDRRDNLKSEFTRGYDQKPDGKQDFKLPNPSNSTKSDSNRPPFSEVNIYSFDEREGMVKLQPNEVEGKKHFFEFLRDGEIIRRDYFSKEGVLQEVIFYGQNKTVFYDASINFIRTYDPETDTAEDRTPEGELLDRLR